LRQIYLFQLERTNFQLQPATNAVQKLESIFAAMNRFYDEQRNHGLGLSLTALSWLLRRLVRIHLTISFQAENPFEPLQLRYSSRRFYRDNFFF